MNRVVFVIAAVAAFLFSNAAEAKRVLVVRGIGGAMVAPMTEIIDGLRKKGHTVTVAEHYNMPRGTFDVAIGHSAGDRVLRSGAKQIITVDPTFLNSGCPRGAKCTNYYAPINAFPFIVCCGGYPVRGAVNIKIPGTPSFIVASPGHVAAPRVVAARIIAGI